MNNSENRPRIRLAELADAEAIRNIYNHYVLNSTCTFQTQPESPEDRLTWLRNHGETHPVVVAEWNGEIVGWGSLSPWNSRCAYSRTVEASIYIHHDQHRKGIGLVLLEDLVARAKAAGHHTMIGGACTEQEASLGLQERLGFRRVALFREVGFKFGRWLDVAYAQLMLQSG